MGSAKTVGRMMSELSRASRGSAFPSASHPMATERVRVAPAAPQVHRYPDVFLGLALQAGKAQAGEGGAGGGICIGGGWDRIAGRALASPCGGAR
jgi:hypothetical protein